MRWLGLACCGMLAAMAAAGAPLTLPLGERPEWVSRDGIVMAGSWEPLLFRVRRDGGAGYDPSSEQRAAYAQEHSPEMVAALKALGVNFVMMHCYKGAGLEAEKESMGDAVRFSALCHDAGLRVGVYTYSGAFLWDLFFKERPDAENWVLLNEQGEKRTYGGAKYRYYWNRNHPEAQAFYKNIVRFAVEDIKTDLIHFDNYSYGPGRDAYSVEMFRQYLKERFSPDELKAMGVADPALAEPVMTGPPDTMLRRVWLNFHAQALSDSYSDMGRYARSLRGDVLMECNPGGPGDRIDGGIDHARLLQGGEAFWDEGRASGYRDGKLYSRIRTYKIARGLNNMAFAYTTTPLEMAESMAFNLDCLGCICWFEYGKIVERPGADTPLPPDTGRYVRFFHQRRDLLRGANVVADVAVLRSYPSQVFGDARYAALTAGVEQMLIERPAAFQVIFDHQLDDLKCYRTVILAGCVAMSDEHAEAIRRYVEAGGRLCVVGAAGEFDEWMRPRVTPALANLPEDRVRVIPDESALFEVIEQLCDKQMTVVVSACPGVCVEVTDQPGRRLVHLVNYTKSPVQKAALDIQLPEGVHAASVMLANPDHEEDAAVPFQENNGRVSFSVPELHVYEIVVVSFKPM